MGVFGFFGGSNKIDEPRSVYDCITCGDVYLKNRNYQKALNMYYQGVRWKSSECALKLYQLYMDGTSVTKDVAVGYFWARMAHDLGNIQATYLVGLCNRDGIGVTRNIVKAYMYLENAARRGHQQAAEMVQEIEKDNEAYVSKVKNPNNEGLCFLNGTGVQSNLVTAIYWFKKGAMQNDMYCCYNLGSLYETGHGVLVDYDEAIRLYSIAAQKGHRAASERLNVLKYRKTLSPQELYQKAKDYMKEKYNSIASHHLMYMAGQLGHEFASIFIGNDFRSERGVRRNYVEALYYYGKTIFSENEELAAIAYAHISEMYALGQGVACNNELANLYFEKARAHSERYQQYPNIFIFMEDSRQGGKDNLVIEGEIWAEGIFCKADMNQAAELWEKSGQNGNYLGFLNIAELYACGFCTERDYNQMMDYHEKAKACENFEADRGMRIIRGQLIAYYNATKRSTIDVLSPNMAFSVANDSYINGEQRIAREYVIIAEELGVDVRELLEQFDSELLQLVTIDEESYNLFFGFAPEKVDAKQIEEIRQLVESKDIVKLYALSVSYWNGDGRERNARLAALCTKHLVDMKSLEGLYSMAECFKNGIGVPVNLELALKILERCEALVDESTLEIINNMKTSILEEMEEVRNQSGDDIRQEYERYKKMADAMEKEYYPEEAWAVCEWHKMASYKLCHNGLVKPKYELPFHECGVDWDAILAEPWEEYLVTEDEKSSIEVISLSNDLGEEIKELPDNLDAYFEGMIGMDSVKEQLNKIYQTVKMQILRDQILVERGEKTQENEKGYNFILLGNPGTGKTTIARIIAKILYDIQIRTSDSFIEIERSGVVSDHVGGTEKRMREILDKVNGGTLFIDEAYALYKEDSDNDFGQEAIDVLMKDMEDHRNSYSVIMAGYREPMLHMIRHANSGFSSRFSYVIELPDYSEEALTEIAHTHIKKQHFEVEEGVDAAIKKCIAHDKLDDTFGNARYVRELVHRAIENQSQRLHESGGYKPEDLFRLKPEDFWQGIREEEGIEKYLAELNSLIGLSAVKTEVESLINLIMVQNEMERRGLNISNDLGTLHMAFKGNPGTGKTTVARIIGKLYASLGVLKRGDVFVECNRTDLVGRYQGHTASNVKKVIESAMGGILFVDEAYSLVQGDGDSFGREAVDALVAEIENNRQNLMIIFAGYSQDMDEFFKNNQGLRSRVPKDLIFEDYNLDELCKIANGMLGRKKLVLTADAEQELRARILKESLQMDFGNARGVRNIVESIWRKQNVRIAGLLKQNAVEVTDEMMFQVEIDDVK